MDEKIYGNLYYNKINDFKGRILDCICPINDIYWVVFNIDDKAISGVNFKYVEYSDLFRKSVVPFKKT